MFQILCWCVWGERVSEEILPVPTWAGGTTQSELATVKETAAKRALRRIPILPSVREQKTRTWPRALPSTALLFSPYYLLGSTGLKTLNPSTFHWPISHIQPPPNPTA